MSRQHHRRPLPVRPTEEAERRETALRHTFVNASSALGSRPAPVRSTFDKAASTEQRRPWKSFAEPLRVCAIEASRRDRAVQDATEEKIIDAILALMHYVLEPLDCRLVGELSFLGVAKEVPEAVEAITDAKLCPTAEKLAVADRESAQAAMALQLHRGGLRRTRDFMRPLGASPMGVA